MKVKDLSGRWHTWNLTGHVPPENATRARSQGHLRMRELLRELYPTDSILEEVSLPGIGLYADFYLPQRKKMVEVHGEQHFKYVPHFHGNPQGFAESKVRDKNKEEWCNINGIEYVAVKDSDDDEIWKEILDG